MPYGTTLQQDGKRKKQETPSKGMRWGKRREHEAKLYELNRDTK